MRGKMGGSLQGVEAAAGTTRQEKGEMAAAEEMWEVTTGEKESNLNRSCEIVRKACSASLASKNLVSALMLTR